jgi:heterodisulfide reductase subunit D
MKYKEALWLCARCGDCSLADKIVASNREVFHPCGVKNVLGFEAYSARGRIMIMNDLLSGELEVTDDIMDWTYTCTTCRNCQETCTATADGIELPEMTEALRRDLFESGHSIQKHNLIEASIRAEANPYNESASSRLDLFGTRNWPKKADYVYFVGCTSSYREKTIAKDSVALLDKIGADYTVLPNEKCCGSVLLRLGRVDAFLDLTRDNIQAIEDTGARAVVTACAGCFRTMKIDAAQQGIKLPFEVYHISEFIDQLIREGKIAFAAPQPIKVTYHDPCHLGRHAEVYEAPRRAIQAISNVKLLEMETNRRYAHCCGSGGGVKASFSDLADKVAANRIQEAVEAGAEMLVTACPFCHKGLQDGATHSGVQLPVLDLPSFVLQFAKSGEVTMEADGDSLKRRFMEYLTAHPRIFEGLKKDAAIDYIIEYDRFHVHVLENSSIEVNPIRAENPDVELTFSPGAVMKLIALESEDDYAAQFGRLFKMPTEEEWIKFNLRRNIVKLLMKGYRKFAQKAGLI